MVRYLVCVLASMLLTGPNPGARKPFSLNLEAVQQKVVSGSQVELRLTLTNTFASEIILTDKNTLCDYTIEVRDSRGESPLETASKRRANCSNQIVVTIGRRILVRLKPGESYPETIFPTEAYDMGRPGDYTIRVMRDIPKEIGRGIVSSNIVTVTVTK